MGKSTLFNALTAAGIASENYPFCTIEPNVGVVEVPDPRLEIINQFLPTQKILHASLKLVDIAGIVKGPPKEKVSKQVPRQHSRCRCNFARRPLLRKWRRDSRRGNR
ncbi:MAG: GTPase [Planctomycetaceae bacterium]